MASDLEESISRSLASLLTAIDVGAELQQCDSLRDVLAGLEYYVSAVLRDVHPYWKRESLDGLLVLAHKTGPREVEFTGYGILITDQAVTPISIRLRIAPSGREIEWLDCRLGEPGNGAGGMKRIPYDAWKSKRLLAFDASGDTIDWVYHVGFGEPPN